MEIAVIPAGTPSLVNKEIETSVQALAFEVSGTHADGDTAREVFEALIGDMTINMQKQDGSNTESIIQGLNVRDLGEICCHNEGVIKITNVDATHSKANFAIEVCLDGALSLSDRAKLMLAIAGVPALTAVSIDGLDHPAASPTYVKYEAKFVNENVGKDFAIDQHFAIALPTDLITAVELTYINGKNVKLSKREIKQLLTDGQDPIYNHDGKIIFGYDKFAVMSTESVNAARITLSASANFFLLKNQAV